MAADLAITSGAIKLATRTYHSSGAVSFSTKGEYGVRLMAQLARRYGRGPASLTEIADEEELPRAYLEQLVTSLRDAELVHSTRGARGGYELTRAPERIVMSEVLRALEGPIAPMICATDDPGHVICERTGRCTVNYLWVRVRDAIAGALDSMTLADLVPVAVREVAVREPANALPIVELTAASRPQPSTAASAAAVAATAPPAASASAD